jgi:hypothetical protein
MKNFRYNTSSHWFKGNTHIHSTASDGGKTFTELAEMYSAAGYDFLFRTDHWIPSDTARDPASYPLLWIDGVELDGEDPSGALFHVACLGAVKGITRKDGLVAGMKAAREQGALLILAHPHWCGLSTEDCLRWNFDGVEVYNHVCYWLNGKSSGLVHWDAALLANPNTLALAVDDAHLITEHPGWNGGWIMVNAPERTPAVLLEAIRMGNFYASCGPEIHSLEWDGCELHLSTSLIRHFRLVGPGWRGERLGSFDGPLFSEIRIPVPDDWQYVYVEIEDDHGKRAWTNNLFRS